MRFVQRIRDEKRVQSGTLHYTPNPVSVLDVETGLATSKQVVWILAKPLTTSKASRVQSLMITLPQRGAFYLVPQCPPKVPSGHLCRQIRGRRTHICTLSCVFTGTWLQLGPTVWRNLL